jgi:hypothetical protein
MTQSLHGEGDYRGRGLSVLVGSPDPMGSKLRISD